MAADLKYMRLALQLARRGYGATSPNPMVGALLVKAGRVIGRGWHRRAGEAHAEIEALRDAQNRGRDPKGSTLYVTLEPCSTHGRTPPCTEAIVRARIRKVVAGATDANPVHSGKGFVVLKRAGLAVVKGVLKQECEELNAAFNHWIVHQTPFVTVKAAMTLDGKIATAQGESKWITGATARTYGMGLRKGVDAILVGINTVLADDPTLTFRPSGKREPGGQSHPLRRVVLDSQARTPLAARVVSDEFASLTTIAVSSSAPRARVAALARCVRVLKVPGRGAGSQRLDLSWLMRHLGKEQIISLLVEGGGEVNASFLLGGLAHRVAFFYAPMVLGGRDARKAVAGQGAANLNEALSLTGVEWRKLGPDWLLTARVANRKR